ncbi:PD-(D/E)XK nuclease family protein [Tenacibaculum aquimarinum]|uniref:PD-(D/E)XK nuclease family protein n=1 Tax=Tenacibaculum aquimarinum TaxID=2910675 RepID=UPI001F0ABE42|nr:PD-(D/E)XK nuclease family protein [Tenacibaculum aquimarinum]MCH3881706.1 PD-(D/E)XK nuclease family protein [Tenacibaculum aquimarinum]
MTNTNIENLQTFLSQNEIPKIKGKPKTFLGIAKQPHYENVVSNIYAFFFNAYEEHNFKDLFIKSLLELISKTKLGKENIILTNTFSNFEIITEFSTLDGGRIDLLLTSPENSIIIENKVYHHLDNDLDDYWSSVQSENKVGVILSLHNISRSNYSEYKNASNYICITHKKLLEQVQKNMGFYLLQANDKYTVFLKDFIQNMMNLSTTVMTEKEIDFYYNFQEKIRETKAFSEGVENHVKAEIEKAGNILNGVTLTSPRSNSNMNSRIRCFISQKNKNLMFTIGFDHLLTGANKLFLIVELQNEALINREKYKEIDFTEDELQVSFSENFTSTNYNWSHFATKEYILQANDIHQLSSFILNKLEEDHFLSIFKKVEIFLEKEK